MTFRPTRSAPPIATNDIKVPTGFACLNSFKYMLFVTFLQGQKHGDKITLRGEAGCPEPSVAPGDVVFVLEQKEHRLFKRINQVRMHGAALLVRLPVTVSHILCLAYIEKGRFM